jgi:hypothetical protein
VFFCICNYYYSFCELDASVFKFICFRKSSSPFLSETCSPFLSVAILAQASIAALRAALLIRRGVHNAMPTRKEMETMEMDAGSHADVEDTVRLT